MTKNPLTKNVGLLWIRIPTRKEIKYDINIDEKIDEHKIISETNLNEAIIKLIDEKIRRRED